MINKEPVIVTDNYVFEHAAEIGQILQHAVNRALWRHKRLGNPVAVWRDGQVVIVPPEEIDIPPDDYEAKV